MKFKMIQVPWPPFSHCVMTAAHIINWLPSTVIANKTPYEKMFNKPPDYTHMKTFGCLAMAYNPDRHKDKFSTKAVPCVFLGYPTTQKGYKLENLLTKQQFISRDVKFYEHVFPMQSTQPKSFMNPLPFNMPSLPSNTILQTEPILSDDDTPTDTHITTQEATDNLSIPSQPQPALRKSTRQTHPPTWLNDFVTTSKTHTDQAEAAAPVVTTNVHVNFANMVTMLVESEFVTTSKTHTDQAEAAAPVVTTNVHVNFANMVTMLVESEEPTSYYEAASQPGWVEAMTKELQALQDNETWDITTLPPGRKAIGCRWVYKSKYKADGSLERKKARLVIQGCSKKQGIEYTHTYAPVAKISTIRALLAVAAMNSWHTCQMDVQNAFLHGDLHEDIYMHIPPGYTSPVSVSNQRECRPLVCKLKKALYGLKQAPRQWFAKLSSALLSFGFTQSYADHSLFIEQTDNTFTAILIYVDDLIITGNNITQIEKVKRLLSSQFHMKDLGHLGYFLGMEFSRTSQGIFISQRKYALDLLKEYGVDKQKPLRLPLDTHMKLEPDDKGALLSNPESYRRLVGQLIYLTLSRPDISFSVQLLSQFMQQPTSVHMQAARRVLRYIK